MMAHHCHCCLYMLLLLLIINILLALHKPDKKKVYQTRSFWHKLYEVRITDRVIAHWLSQPTKQNHAVGLNLPLLPGITISKIYFG